ncbi:MAG TPA: hypothetical protein VE269_06980, partial [Gaiellaceae bacterium]|nr:hypothetical protein [Gaiellaceae bacterium]
ATARAVRYAKRLAVATLLVVLAACAAVAFGYVRADAPAAVTCTVSPRDHDANVVASGVGADHYCAARAHELAWATRPGFALRSPDLGQTLTIVCALRQGGLRITIYDDGRRRIGGELCARYSRSGSATNA